jgi:hypothetical protein
MAVKKLFKWYIWSVALCGAETWTLVQQVLCRPALDIYGRLRGKRHDRLIYSHLIRREKLGKKIIYIYLLRIDWHQDFYCSTNISVMKWVGHVARMVENKNENGEFVLFEM